MKQDKEKVSKGIFVNYQIAEAITAIKQYDLSTEYGLEGAKKLLEDFKKRWQEKDKIPGYNLPIGKNMVGMDDISIEEIIEISESLEQYDVYSCECAANMQYCMIRDHNGKIAFDFSALEKIANLARANNKKVVIDSAIVFGDHFPENMKTMTKSEIEEAIALYVETLETNFGDCIDRIDVLNSVFQRKDVLNKEGTFTSEEFWINIFGKDYATDVLRIVRENLNNPDIQLCWNEFYITNENDPQRLLDFVQRIKETEYLDVIGLQDKFRSDASVEYIQNSLLKLVNLCKEKNLKLAITELGCGITRNDIELLNAAKNNGNYEETLQDVNKRIQTIVASVEKIAQNSDTIISVEERYSDKFDYNNRDIRREHGHDVNTTGKSKTNKTLTLNQIGKGTTKEFSSNPKQASRAFETLESGIRTQEEIKDGQTQGEE